MVVKQQVANESARSFVRKLQDLDWGPIAYKLIYPESGQGWTQEQTKRAISRYIIFLTLKHLYPNVGIVPTQEIDQVWHTHILDTAKYAQECQQVFGYFLHHFPYMGMRGETDRKNWQSAFAQTKSLFAEHFGVSMAEIAGEGEGTQPGFCILRSEKDSTQPSFCILRSEKDSTQPSFCILRSEKDSTQPSFCILRSEKDSTQPSFCILRSEKDSTRPRVEVNVDPVQILEAKVA